MKTIRKKNILIVVLYILGALALTMLAIYLYFEYQGRHYNSFQINNRHEVRIISKECQTCFLDWEVNHYITLVDLKNGKEYEHHISTGEGPYLRFFDLNKNGQIQIDGYNQNSNSHWLINKNELKELDHDDSIPTKTSDYYELSGDFKIIKK